MGPRQQSSQTRKRESDGARTSLPAPKVLSQATAVRMRADGHTYREIAGALGCSITKVQFLLHPERAERSRQKSREAKQRRTGTCVDCGAVTHYNGTDGKSVSERCLPCSQRIWTAETVIDAIRRFATANGRPPTATEWENADPERNYPAATSCYRSRPSSPSPFASWNEAIEAAGLTATPRGQYERTEHTRELLSRALRGVPRPHTRGPRLESRRFDWDEIRRLRDEGLTYRAIAARVGCHVSTVYLALHRTYDVSQGAA